MDHPKRLQELLNHQGGNYILPFLWMHGEGKAILKEEIDRIEACGIREICLEARPHPDFMGPKWWEEVDFIMEEARARHMRIWLLDDDKFPVGHANGAFEKKPELAKLYLAQRHMDVLGPCKESGVLIEPFLGTDGEVLAVLACPKPDTDSLDVSGEGILDLTHQITEGVVYFDIPEGLYRVFVLFTTRKNGGRLNYMNLIDSASVRVLLDEVYEPHYDRYKEDFGKTFAGFFSDEPELGNTSGYVFQDHLGKHDVKLPWSEELKESLSDRWGKDYGRKLPALWYEMGKETAAIRSDYMDCVTRLVETCFVGQVSQWCHEHGVEYMGHIIEDDNAHSRLGCSIGHFFRAQKGQDMSGIDVVLLQIIPGFHGVYHQWIASDRDGEFFHFGLAKLGSSYAHIDEKKVGRALCEIFGAYGWAEGVSLMKWLTDHMLVRGINVFIPHAFSPSFPDRDCPPHFYARGNNPQYRFFVLLMKYMNRMSHLLNGGIHAADAAVLYHAEAEWSSGETMLFQKPVRALLEHQMDCDVIPADYMSEDKIKVSKGIMTINKVAYQSFVIPYCEYLPEAVMNFAIEAVKEGLKIYMIDAFPVATVHGAKIDDAFKAAVSIVALDELASTLKREQSTTLKVVPSHKDLRTSCYRQEDGNVYMFFNESTHETISGQVSFLKAEQGLVRYSPLDNTYEQATLVKGSLQIQLLPGEAAIYMTSSKPYISRTALKETETIALNLDWNISIASALNYPEFEKKLTLKAGEKLPNMNGKGYFPKFTGTFRYEGTLHLQHAEGKKYTISFPALGDCGEVWINDQYAGMMIGNPYLVDITSNVVKGDNKLVIEVTNTLVWQVHDGQSTHMQLNPTGMTQIPQLHIYK